MNVTYFKHTIDETTVKWLYVKNVFIYNTLVFAMQRRWKYLATVFAHVHMCVASIGNCRKEDQQETNVTICTYVDQNSITLLNCNNRNHIVVITHTCNPIHIPV